MSDKPHQSSDREPDQTRAELEKVRQAIAAQEAVGDLLPAGQQAAMLAALRDKEAMLAASLSGRGSQAIGEQARAAYADRGGLAIAGDVRGNVYLGPPPKDSGEALAIYRRVLRQSCGQISLRGVDVGTSDPTAGQQPLSLANVYIDLDTTAAAVDKEALASALPGLVRQTASGRGERDEEKRPLSALEAMAACRQLVLLGDPGGGKSTFANHLAHCLTAHALEPEAGWLKQLSGWPEAEAGLLPLLVMLRDFAQSLPEPRPGRAEPRQLWDFIAARLGAQNLSPAADPIHQLLEKGRALVLLDGLDEVPAAGQRAFVRDAVYSFIERYPANRYLVTCRTLAYQPPAIAGQPDLRLPASIPSFELAPFDEDKIDRFIAAWYEELVRLGSVRSERQAGLTRQLRQAVRRPDLWRLAPNPLLLTVMALVHTHHGRLPDARALLYEETVDILLWRWEQVKAGGQAEAPRLRQLLLAAERTDMDLKKVLWRLAYEAHAQGQATEAPEQLADIGELKLQKALAGLKDNDLNWAAQLIETMKLRAGLLLERAPEVFTFPHRTFQEYLAGAHLAARPDFAALAAAHAAEGALWREVILLAVGRLAYREGDTAKPLALAAELCPSRPPATEAGWRQVWLAGEALLEMGLKRAQDSALGRDLLERIRRRLVQLLAGSHLSPRERAAAGSVLGRLGDPRRGVGLRQDGLPDIEWREVEAGPFVRGSADDTLSFIGTKETPQQEVDLPAFAISCYPATNAQFEVFVQDEGYSERWRHCWTEAGWKWKGDRMAPDTAGGAFDLPNHPVVMVRWYEAVAFCRWLSAKLQEAGELGPGEEITLPSESQWEKAARGPSTGSGQAAGGRIYPWGNEIDPNRANYRETGIGTTSAAGCFPQGSSPYGCQEMSGNVWEWCATKFEESYENYRDDNDLEGDSDRVLRGGSFYGSSGNARCASRDRYYPLNRGGNYGFRVVLVRPHSL